MKAIRRAGLPSEGRGDLAGGQQLLHLHVGDDVRRAAVAQMTKPRSVVGFPAGGLHDGADAKLRHLAVGPQRDVELAGLAGDRFDRRAQVDANPLVLLDLPDLRPGVGRFDRPGKAGLSGKEPGELLQPAAELGSFSTSTTW